MKIAYIVNSFPELSETFILNRITGLLEMGHDVEIFAECDPKRGAVHSDVERYNLMERVHYCLPQNITQFIQYILKGIWVIIISFPKIPIRLLKSLNKLKDSRTAPPLLKLLSLRILLLNKKFDIIHCSFGQNGIIGVCLKKIGVPGKYVTSFHGFDISSFILANGNDVYKDLFLNGDLFLPACDHIKRKLVKLNCDENKIVVHHAGINLEKFMYSERKIQAGRPIRILTIGRLAEVKGHKYAIKAMAEVAKRYKDIEYIIAGEGLLREELEKLVLQLGISNCVKFLGAVNQDKAVKLYQQAHIFILPSVTASDGDTEATPVVLTEALAVGLPAISTHHGGISELVVNGKSGFLVPEKNIDALVKKILYLIEHPEIWPEMGRLGRKFVEENFDIKKLNTRLVEIYKSLLCKK